MEYVHWAEDADIVPAQTLYLTGCNLSCRFCQTADERARLPSARLDSKLFAGILARGKAAGARTVNILGGEPTVNLPALLEIFAETGDFPGLVWNSNLYGTAEAFALLDGIVDIYMGDIKFGNSACAKKLAGAADAGEAAAERAMEIFARSPEALIVRHLLLPGHFACCAEPVLRWIACHLPGVRVSLKTVYMPPRDLAERQPEKRFLTPEETSRANRLALSLGLRLTRDAASPPPGGDETGNTPGIEPTAFETIIASDGAVYLRHVTREASEMLRAAVGGPY
jgi:putative pyruvate formate lyase activating enzyme